MVCTYAGIALHVEPTSLIVDDGESARLVIEAGDVAIEDLQLQVELGKVTPLRRTSTDAFEASWSLPDDLQPRQVAAAVVNTKTRSATFTTLRAFRRARFRVHGQPAADVKIMFGAEVVTETIIPAGGDAVLSVPVPPGAQFAVIEQRVPSRDFVQTETRAFDLKNALRAWMIPLSMTIGEQQSDSTALFVFVYTDVTPPVPRLQSALGPQLDVRAFDDRTLRSVKLGPDTYRVEVPRDLAKAAAQSGKDSLEIVATVDHEGQVASANLTINLIRGVPHKVTLSRDDETWEVGTFGEFGVEVVDIWHLGVEGVRLQLLRTASDGLALVPEQFLEDAGDGRYRLLARAPQEIPSENPAGFAVRIEPGGLLSNATEVLLTSGPPEHVVLSRERSNEHQVVRSNEHQVVIVVEVVDRHGNSAIADRLILEVDAGTLSISESNQVQHCVTTWSPMDPRVSERVDLIARIPTSHTTDHLQFRHEGIGRGWHLAPFIGALTDFGRLQSLAGGISLSYALSGSWEQWALMAEFWAGWTRRDEQISWIGVAQSTPVERSVWLFPVSLGAKHAWYPNPDWEVSLALGSGVLFTQASINGSDQGPITTSSAEQLGIDWLFQLSMTVARRLGPGQIELQLRALDAVTASGAWDNRPRAVGGFLGYDFQPGGG
ncbi:MAG: hypothetical protein A2289_25975 [Deltaproteobacteria bacterium RIFOXYA12_FULL_58_15]|nr:MAG: hypothetical protein A2289_25975 [Deltaproteobacteria bacterium RIFOXYA12_FULL_58_15]OGR11644.1 MAG: hypothetical protein A2341_02720 [Deltaproteobacteria bacterium RIFOXYB12_FULL_58_9]